MKNGIFRLLPIALIWTQIGCETKSAPLISPRATVGAFSRSASFSTVDITTTAEVVAILDNSGSMGPRIENVAANLETWAEKFTENNPLKIHFSVLPIYDAKIWSQPGYIANCGRVRNGLLRAVRDAEGNVIRNQPHFVTSEDPNFLAKIKATLKIAVAQPYSSVHDANRLLRTRAALAEARSKGITANEVNGCGPELEESLSPLTALYSASQGLQYPENRGFHLAQANKADKPFRFFMFVTDAASEEANPDQVAKMFIDMSDGDMTKISAFGALFIPGYQGALDPKCVGDGAENAGSPRSIMRFIRNVNGRQTHVCSRTFGEDMAAWGRELREKTVTRTVRLNTIPGWDPYNKERSIRLFYGVHRDPTKDTEIENGDGGFKYDPDSQTLTLDSDVKIKPVPGGQLYVIGPQVNANAIRDRVVVPAQPRASATTPAGVLAPQGAVTRPTI